MSLERIGALIFYVADAARSADLYGDLGFEVIKSERGHAIVTLDGMDIEFHDADEPDQPAYRTEQQSFAGNNSVYVYVRCTEVDQHFRLVSALDGVTVVDEPTNTPWGNREFVIKDPDDHLVAFYSRP